MASVFPEVRAFGRPSWATEDEVDDLQRRRSRPGQLNDLMPVDEEEHVLMWGCSDSQPPTPTRLPPFLATRWWCSGGSCSGGLPRCPRMPFLQPPVKEQLRHLLLSLRLSKAYIVYSFLCFLLSAMACFYSFGRAAHVGLWKGGNLASQEWHPWEAPLEAFVGFVICAETSIMLWLSGREDFLRDFFGVFDASVALLTLLTWGLLAMRNTVTVGDTVLHLDMPLLTLRFVMQFCRMLAAASVTKRVHEMQKHTLDVQFDFLDSRGGLASPANEDSGRILDATLKAEVCQHLPVWCRFKDWELTYSTHEHGTSLQTFYRTQEHPGQGAGANLLVVRDALGGVFGGFVDEPWRPCSQGFHGSRDCFVFSMLPGEAVRFFHVMGGTPELLLWGTSSYLCLNYALELHQDLERGCSAGCAAFGSPVLSAEGPDFAVGTFECWSFV